MADVDVSILKQMRENIKGGFDEERFGPRMGFQNLKKWVGTEMTRPQRESSKHPETHGLNQVSGDVLVSFGRWRGGREVGWRGGQMAMRDIRPRVHMARVKLGF